MQVRSVLCLVNLDGPKISPTSTSLRNFILNLSLREPYSKINLIYLVKDRHFSFFHHRQNDPCLNFFWRWDLGPNKRSCINQRAVKSNQIENPKPAFASMALNEASVKTRVVPSRVFKTKIIAKGRWFFGQLVYVAHRAANYTFSNVNSMYGLKTYAPKDEITSTFPQG